MSNPDPQTFALRSTPAGTRLLVEVVGEVDMVSAPAIVKAVELTPEGTSCVVIDLSEVSFIDSSGLNALVQARRHLADREIAMQVVVPPTGAIRRVFEITHLTESLTVIDTLPPLD